jgi:adenosylcobinamide-phosphate synthase
MTFHFAAAALALLVERLIGYPDALHRLIGHPVEWMGKLVNLLEVRLNDPALPPRDAKFRGLAALAMLVAAVGLPAFAITYLLRALPYGWIAEALMATSLLAQKSLCDHVADVEVALRGSLQQGRDAVSRIVGRDPQALDESGVACAALESLGENASDGIVAPLLYLALFGLPGIAIYKAINTADSMIGHKNERYLQFGWASARLDDLVNLPASRLSGLLFAAAAAWENAADGRNALRSMWRDARKHRSPNAGWPEAALAGALGISLGGPRSYHGEMVDLPSMGDARRHLTRDDIARGLRLYGTMLTMLLIFTAVCASVF